MPHQSPAHLDQLQLEAAPRFPVAEDVRSEQVDAGGIPAEWINTPEAVHERVIYYLHGGGYVLGSINTHRGMISRVPRAAKARALAIDYRLAPENPFPAAIEDAVAAYRWLLSIGVDPSRLVIAGDSAGGGIDGSNYGSTVGGRETSAGSGGCISPWADLECTGKSMMKTVQEDAMVVWESILRMVKAYLGGADPRTPLASPIHAALRRLPPLLIEVGTAEGLPDDAKRLTKRAKAGGVDVIMEP